jgi:ribosomal protein L11 methyltransferase
MPYRIDITSPSHDALDRLVQLGALDVEETPNGLAAILPDGVTPDDTAAALGVTGVSVSPAIGRDDGSVWLLKPRPVDFGNVRIALSDSPAFGTGHHPTTALCVEAIAEAVSILLPDRMLDVGTGSGILALAALMMGVPRATGLDIDADALAIAAEHARMNKLEDRIELVLGGPDAAKGAWPLVVANILAAPLIEMAPTLVRRVASRGRLILSGIPQSVGAEVTQSYTRLGMRQVRTETRAGWAVSVLQASW